jgi:hypothetical protein
MAQGIDVESKANCKLLLRHPQPPANRPSVNLRRNVDDILARVGFAFDKGKCLSKALKDPICDFSAHCVAFWEVVCHQ